MLNTDSRNAGLISRMRIFRAANGAVAGVEFALVAPFLITLFLGTVEISRYLGVQKRVQNAASDLALAISASDDQISGATLWRHYTMLPVLIPDVISDMRLAGQSDWSRQARLNVSFVVANKIGAADCGANCKSRFTLLWSYGRDRRDCGEWKISSDKEKDGLPKLFYNEGQNFVAVEIRYTFQPLFVRFLQGKVELTESFYAPPRYFDRITVNQLGDSSVNIANVCT